MGSIRLAEVNGTLVWVADDFSGGYGEGTAVAEGRRAENLSPSSLSWRRRPGRDVTPANVRQQFAGGIYRASTGAARYRLTLNRVVPWSPGSNTYTSCSPGRSCDSLTRRYCCHGRSGAGVWYGLTVAAGLIP